MARVSKKSVVPPEKSRPVLAVRVFQLPGNLVADLLKATEDDDRMAVRVLIDMLFWNLVVVVAAVVVYGWIG
ncbi:MAG: hypothetical protein ABI369_07960 [Acetobacteraceae bacterium]